MKAESFCREQKYPAVECEHILYLLLLDDSGIFTNILEKLNVSKSNILKLFHNYFDKSPKVETDNIGLSPKIQDLFISAQNLVTDWDDKYISSEHIILSYFENENNALVTDFNNQGLSKENIKEEKIKGTENAHHPRFQKEEKYEILFHSTDNIK